MASDTPQEVILDALPEDTVEILEQVKNYGSLIGNGIILTIVGLLVVFILHRFASRFIYPFIKNKRLARVIFGVLYVLVLVITILLGMERMGLDTRVISKIVLLTVFICAMIIYFLVPFFPRLPFKIGHMVEIGGILGIVDSISNFHTTVRKLDGTMVFIPNPVVLSSKISNYHDTPTRRIEIQLNVNNDSDLEETKSLFLRLMSEDERVLEEPSPPAAFVVSANASGVDMLAFCWVKNEDWFSTRSDLWLKLVDAFLKDDRLSMSLPQQEVHVIQEEC